MNGYDLVNKHSDVDKHTPVGTQYESGINIKSDPLSNGHSSGRSNGHLNGTPLLNGHSSSNSNTGNTMNSVANIDPSIGRAVGGNVWVVCPDAPHRLAAIGAIGELWLEGPLVGQGYLRDSGKTASSFIDTPDWLLCGTKGHNGRRGRLYRTGDLVCYDSEGNLMFVGRKDDSYVKIRGQRFEFGEIEYRIRKALPANVRLQVVAEVISPHDSGNHVLVAFVGTNLDGGESFKAVFKDLAAEIDGRLRNSLPDYMYVYRWALPFPEAERALTTLTHPLSARP